MAKKPSLKHGILITIGLVLLTFAIYTPAYSWLEDTLTPVAVVIVDTQTPRFVGDPLFCWDGIEHVGCVASDPNRPGPVPPETTGAIYVFAGDRPPEGSGIDTVTGEATKGTPTTLSFSRSSDWWVPPIPPHDLDEMGEWKATFTTPIVGQSFTITITLTDKTGNVATTTFYCTTTEPTGDFYINDQKVTVESIIYIKTLTLNIKFIATGAGSSIDRVFYRVYNKDETIVYVHDEDLTETVADTEWTVTYTLPSEGEFRVYGYFMIRGIRYQRMFIGIDTGIAPTPPATYYRFFLGLMGFIFVVYPVYDIYAEEKTKT